MVTRKEVTQNKYGLKKTYFKQGSRMEAAFNFFLKYKHMEFTFEDLALALHMNPKDAGYILQRLKFKGIIKIAKRKFQKVQWQIDKNSEIVKSKCRKCYYGTYYYTKEGYLQCDNNQCKDRIKRDISHELLCHHCKISWIIKYKEDFGKEPKYCSFCSAPLEQIKLYRYNKPIEMEMVMNE